MEKYFMDDALEALKKGDTAALQRMLGGQDAPAPEVEAPVVEVEETLEEVPDETTEVEVGESAETQETSEVPVEDAKSAKSAKEVKGSAKKEVAPPKLPDTEDITITDDKGKRSYTIDYTDRPKIKKAFEYAAGFRKMQAERDRERKQASELKESYSKLEELWGEGGQDGIRRVVTQLAGGEKGLQEFFDSEFKERQRLANMTPEEKAALEKQRADEARALEWETKMRDLSAKEKAYQDKLAQEEEARLKSSADSAYARFNFEGKLGNEKAEQMWNKTLWTNAIELLEKHTPEGVTPTQANFNKAFEIAFNNLNSTLKTNVEKTVEKAIDAKKVDAGKRAAVMAKKGLAPKPTSADELNATIDKGDFAAGFKSIFQASKRLF